MEDVVTYSILYHLWPAVQLLLLVATNYLVGNLWGRTSGVFLGLARIGVQLEYGRLSFCRDGST